jgi:hypothetical protein
MRSEERLEADRLFYYDCFEYDRRKEDTSEQFESRMACQDGLLRNLLEASNSQWTC